MNAVKPKYGKAAAIVFIALALLLTAGAFHRFLPHLEESMGGRYQTKRPHKTILTTETDDMPRSQGGTRARSRNRTRSEAAANAPDDHRPPEGVVPGVLDLNGDSATSPLAPAGIAGYVYDLEGVGIIGASVQLQVEASSPDASEGNYSARTGKNGAYRIPNITHFGKALLSATAPGFTTVYSQENGDMQGTTSLQRIVEGMHYKAIDFTLHPVVAALRGRVITPQREGVAGARVVVAKQNCRHFSQEDYWTLSRENGAFQIALPCDASCIVVAYKTGFAPTYLAKATPGAGDITIIMRDGGAIVGSVFNTRGEPVQGQKIVITPNGVGKDAPNPWLAPKWVAVVSQGDGGYAARDLSEAFTYTIQAPYPLEKLLKSTADSHTLAGFIQDREREIYFTNQHRFYREEEYGYTPLAEIKDVVVRAGQETHVDLTIDEQDSLPAVIHGHITDAATGDPLSPMYLFAVGSEKEDNDGLISMAVTQENGAYRLLCHGLPEPTPISVRIEYCMSNIDSSMATVMRDIVLGPGDEAEVNYAMTASVSAPVRVVWSTGQPIPRAEVSNVLSDDDGRLTLYGLAPYETHQLIAWADEDTFRSTVPLGSSAPFSGKPGERVPEIVITCPLLGSVVGRLILPDGMTHNPTGEIVPCHTLEYSTAGPPRLGAFLSPDGTLRVPMAPQGIYTLKFLVLAENDEDDDFYHYAAIIEDVVVVAGQETDIGLVIPAYEEEPF